MSFGYTYIERSLTGRVENDVFAHFATFKDCCAAAQAAMVRGKENGIVRIQVVPCEYDDHRCTPLIMSVLRSFDRTPQVRL